MDDLGRATAKWVGGLYIGYVLLQRFAVPGTPVALLLPYALAASGWGVLLGLATFHRGRFIAWLLTAGFTALIIPVQSFILDRPLVSVGSWALWMTVWLPFTLHLVDRRLATYLGVLRIVVNTSAVLAGGCLLMMATQYAGLPYRDYFAQIVPTPFQLDGFVITYPVSYGSPIYRANAWIGLEPSMISLQLGLGLVAALLVGTRTPIIALLLAGLVTATSGSGFAIIVVAVVVLMATSARNVLKRYLIPAVAALTIGLASPMGQTILGRLGSGNSDPSLSLRAIYPYIYLWPGWSGSLSRVLFGEGPGSSQQIVGNSGVVGLLVPTPVKIFFDYGLLAGVVLAAMMIFCFAGGHSRAIAITLLVSLWTLQPGTTAMVVVMPALLLVTWWSPRVGERAMESLYATKKTRTGYRGSHTGVSAPRRRVLEPAQQESTS